VDQANCARLFIASTQAQSREQQHHRTISCAGRSCRMAYCDQSFDVIGA
jgi:hypothetical protein